MCVGREENTGEEGGGSTEQRADESQVLNRLVCVCGKGGGQGWGRGGERVPNSALTKVKCEIGCHV